jgi:hypothetical protein
LYTPGLRSSDNVLLPPWNVGVAPRAACEEDSIVTLCDSEAVLVKAIDTLPALAVSELVSYLSRPSALAARFSVCAALAPEVDVGAGAAFEVELGVGAGPAFEVELVVGVVAAFEVELVVGAVAAAELELDVGVALVGDDAEELVLVEELPQPASTTRQRSETRLTARHTGGLLPRPAACTLTEHLPRVVGL